MPWTALRTFAVRVDAGLTIAEACIEDGGNRFTYPGRISCGRAAGDMVRGRPPIVRSGARHRAMISEAAHQERAVQSGAQTEVATAGSIASGIGHRSLPAPWQ